MPGLRRFADPGYGSRKTFRAAIDTGQNSTDHIEQPDEENPHDGREPDWLTLQIAAAQTCSEQHATRHVAHETGYRIEEGDQHGDWNPDYREQQQQEDDREQRERRRTKEQ